jgi:uncharacterized protein
MLTSTFIHVPGVGYTTERRIWQMGVPTWEHFVRSHADIELPEGKKALILPYAEESILRLRKRDHAYFAGVLPAKEHWRAVSEFRGEIGYLDIETTGFNWNDVITVIGLYDGYEMRHFVRGLNLDEFPSAVSGFKLLVTFFGSVFDLPVIRRSFTGLSLSQLHVDLCFLLKRLGLGGGLKSIETQLGLRRRSETEGLDGFDAVRLWAEYLRGSQEALDLLLLYNKEDVMNMEFLLSYACSRMEDHIRPLMPGSPEAPQVAQPLPP